VGEASEEVMTCCRIILELKRGCDSLNCFFYIYFQTTRFGAVQNNFVSFEPLFSLARLSSAFDLLTE
jgi:hypothetical protein